MSLPDPKSKTEQARKTKKIMLEIWEDSEATFYLALSNLRNAKTIDNDLKLLLDTICFPEISKDQYHVDLQRKLQIPWNYIYKADKFSRGDYSRVSGESFASFLNSEFGVAMLNAYYHCDNIITENKDKDNLRFKTDLAYFSSAMEAFKKPDSHNLESSIVNKVVFPTDKIDSPGHSVELGKDGVFKFTDENLNSYQLEFYVFKDNALHKVISFEEFQNFLDYDLSLVNTGKSVVIHEKSGEYLISKTFHGASIKNNILDLQTVTSSSVVKQPLNELPLFDSMAPPPYKKMLLVESTDYYFDESNAPLPIDKGLAKNYLPPRHGTLDSFIRFEVMRTIYTTIHKWFPELSRHVKSTITGYFCIPFNMVNSEEGNKTAPRSSSYHNYVGKAVRNVFDSKFFKID